MAGSPASRLAAAARSSIEGTVNITGVQYFDVAARSIFVGGEISDSAMQAEVGLFAGRNNFDYNARTATALADDGSAKPAFGIDASAGSIRAGKIAAASTEKGVGMRTGNLQAGAGGMMLTADGKLVLGKTQSQGAISAKSVSGDIQLAGPALVAGVARSLGGRQYQPARPGVGRGAGQRDRHRAGAYLERRRGARAPASTPPRAILPAAAR